MRNVPGLETIYRDYQDKVQIFYVYKALAHPERDGYVQPVTVEERLIHVKEAKRRLDMRVPWICDTISNDLKHAFGDRSNSEFVIGSDGKFIVVRDWSDPAGLREDLERLAGAVDKPTTVAELGRKPQQARRAAASGVVPRLEHPDGLTPLKLRAKMELQGGEPLPFYVKLRAEAQADVMRGEHGKLLLGFHLDPIYDVHWNDLAAPVKFSIMAPEGTLVAPLEGKGPVVKEEADIDPREFIVDVSGASSEKPLVLKVDYFACNDAGGWCKAVSQEYRIFFIKDHDAGRVAGAQGGGGRDAGGGAGGSRGRRPGRGGASRPDPSEIIERILVSDADGDGKLSKKEAPARIEERFDAMDANNDGFVDRAEIESRFKGGLPGAPGRPRPGGRGASSR
jgi:hypothetical protein